MDNFKELSLEEMREVDKGKVLTGIGIPQHARFIASGI